MWAFIRRCRLSFHWKSIVLIGFTAILIYCYLLYSPKMVQPLNALGNRFTLVQHGEISCVKLFEGDSAQHELADTHNKKLHWSIADEEY